MPFIDALATGACAVGLASPGAGRAAGRRRLHRLVAARAGRGQQAGAADLGARPPPLETVQPAPAAARGGSKLPPPRRCATWAEVRQQAAERLVAANPDITYTGKPPERCSSIPVLEVELNADGSVRRIEVLRAAALRQGDLQTAADAVRRAAPYGDVSRLPKPWKFVETFLFDEHRKFKPRTLDN